jgi:hypothetical protein
MNSVLNAVKKYLYIFLKLFNPQFPYVQSITKTSIKDPAFCWQIAHGMANGLIVTNFVLEMVEHGPMIF